MARVFQTGWENNTSTDNCFLSVTGSPQILSGAPARTGTYYLRVNNTGAGENVRYQFATTDQTSPHFYRAYIYIVAAPTSNKYILRTYKIDLTARFGIKLTSALKLQLFNTEDNVQIGSDSDALSLNTWYRVEYTADLTTLSSSALSARIDGSEFASGTANFAAGVGTFIIGSDLSDATLDIYYDDLAVNNTSGSFQNSWPGSGKIIHLRPSAAGDSNGFLTQVGGTAGASNNFTRVNEVTPDDATSYNGSALLSAEDLFNCDDSGIGAFDSVNVVSVGVKMADLVGADATAAFKVELEKTASGTKAQSGALIPNSTTWVTNAAAAAFIYPLITYQDPDGGTWTQATLDSMQIGYIQTAINVQTIAISTVWASVDYTPASSGSPNLALMGVG